MPHGPYRRSNSQREFEAWSQNLGHEGVLTTFYCYGYVAPQRQSEIMHALRAPREAGLRGAAE